MPTKKKADKKPAPAKKTVAKKKGGSPKKTVAKKVTAKKETTKKAPAKKKAGVVKSASTPEEKAAPSNKPKASDFIKRPSHTPAIFKPASKRPIHILFTIEDVRELLKKRSKEEQLQRAQDQLKSGQQINGIKGLVVVDDANPKNSKHHAATLDDILGLSAPAAQKSASSKVPRKFQKFYKLLIELRDHVREELNLHSSDTLKRSQKEDAGDISISVDAGTDNFDRDFALSLLSSEQE
ncbi:MAG TPA: hypothetical protein VK995_05635, partial [Oceanipulchritudo sp.]|nr:hypothetical protein [Oceanipulchritudo sp.]